MPVFTADGVYWLEKGNNRRNFGIAHGIPSIILFLTKCYQNQIDCSTCKTLIENGINWILKQTLESGAVSKFPYVLGDKRPTRVSWCYGDMCIAFVLILAGERLQRNDWIQKGIELGVFSGKRRNHKDMKMNDVCFCHGTAGNAHLFGRLYAYTKNELFKESAVFWLNETIMKYKRDNLSGLKTWYGHDGYQYGYSLLEGLAGIGLSLLAATGRDEPNWDSIF